MHRFTYEESQESRSKAGYTAKPVGQEQLFKFFGLDIENDEKSKRRTNGPTD